MQKQDDLSQLSVMGSTSAHSHYIERLEKKFVKGLKLNQKLFTCITKLSRIFRNWQLLRVAHAFPLDLQIFI